MNVGSADITVDGIAMTTAVKSQLAASEGTVDIIELRRKVERKEAEIKRKDREIGSLQRDLQKSQKENKDLQGENENLNRSLTNARMLNASVLDDSVQVELRHQISGLENQLAASEASVNDIKGELEAYRANNAGLQEGMEETTATKEYTTHLHRTAMQDVQDLNMKVKLLQAQISDKDEKIGELEKTLEKAHDSERRFKSMTEHQSMLLSAHDKSLVDQAAEIKSLKNAIQVRNDTNHSLRNQVEELSDNNFVLSKNEMDHLRKMENDNESYQTRIRDLVKSVELHMDLLQRAEAESAALRTQAEENSALVAEYKKKSEERVQLSETDHTTLKFLKKEVVKLRNENKDLSQRCETSNAELQAMQSLRGGVAGAGMPSFKNNGADSGELNKMSHRGEQDRQLRCAAEEATRALRNRMSFLLEQMEQASQLAASWQEQKAILKAEIGSLLRANHDLRERLVSVQRNFMGQTLYDAEAHHDGGRGSNGTHAFVTSSAASYQQHEAAERLAEGLVALEQMGDSLQGPYMQPVPSSAEALVERRLFDAVCAFSLGARADNEKDGNVGVEKSKNRRRTIKFKGNFKVSQTADSRVDICVEDGDVDALELLASLQIPAFLKFVQSRPPEKIPRLFTEKMANVLNFSRQTVHDFLEQLGDARMQLGKLQSKVSVAWERVSRVRDRCTKERLSKQKSVMRYIREQLRISDIRKILSEVGQRATEHLDDLIHTERGGLLGMRDQAMKDTMAQLVQASKDLTALATGTADGAGDTASLTSSAETGSIEIRLADSQLDDETVHGVVGLVCGVLAPGAQNIGGSEKNEPYDGYHRMIAGETNNGNVIDRNGGGTDILMSSLGVKVSERQVSTANSLARSILAVRCDYTERIIFMNLKGNSLTDLSCKVLAAMVEKSSTLRMLDLRENLLSTTGAKFLFDATRRNITVLYVTQRQNGYMIEGHREILGNGAPKYKTKSGNSYDNPGTDISDTGRADEIDDVYPQLQNGGADEPKHPLRIDMRNNNPSKEAIEGLLESVEYKSAVRYIPPSEDAPPDQPLSLRTIVNDARTFEEAYSGQPTQEPSSFLMSGGGEDRHSSFTPAGLTRNQFSGMLSTVPGEHVHPFANGERRSRPKSAGGYGSSAATTSHGDRPTSATKASIGNRLYSSVRNHNLTSEYEDDYDMDLGVGSDIKDMITSRKDREKGINGVGGLLEQQIRKLQLTQPMTSGADPGRSNDILSSSNENSWEAYDSMKKAEKETNFLRRNAPERQEQIINAYSSTTAASKAHSQRRMPDKFRRTITGKSGEKSTNNVSGFVNVVRRAKSAGQTRPGSGPSGLNRTRSRQNGQNSMKVNSASSRKASQPQLRHTTTDGSRLPRVGSVGRDKKAEHHEGLQNRMNDYNMNPALLF